MTDQLKGKQVLASHSASYYTPTDSSARGHFAGIDAELAGVSLIDGSRAYTGTVAGVTPTSGSHLVTKDYVDSHVEGIEWQDSVADRDLTAPPGSPSTGDRYIVATGGTGAWSGHDTEIAEWDGAAWEFTTPTLGMVVSVDDESRHIRWTGAIWDFFGKTVDHGALLGLSDNDHPQYLSRDGSAAMTGDLNMGSHAIGSVGNVDGRDVSADGATLDAHVGAGGAAHANVSNSAAGFVPAVGSQYTVLTSTGSAGSWAMITNNNVSASAGIVVSKLNAGGTANRVLLTTDGSTTSWAQITNAQVSSAAAIGVTKLAAGSDGQVLANIGGTNQWTALTDALHGDRSGGSLHAVATISVAGFMSAADKTKLDNVEAGAEVNALPVTSNKDMAALTTTSDGDKATNTTLATAPADGSYIAVTVNGINCTLGDGVKTQACYFSGDAGSTARAYSAIAVGDTLHWVGSVAGYQLETTDSISCFYSA